MKTLDWVSPNLKGDWLRRHRGGVAASISLERPIVYGIRAWVEYAEFHRCKYESLVGEDYVLGPAWAQWGAALRELLNGDLGRLDAGTLDTILHDNLKEQGFDPDTL